MLESRDDLMSIVVLEAGAAWPAWLGEYQRLAPNAVVIVQARAEELEPFKSRVIHRIDEVTSSSGARVRVGVMVSAPQVAEDRRAFRESVARAILKVIDAGGDAELVLAGDGQDGDPARHELFALAGALCEELGGTKVNVCVRFSNSKSGVMRSVASDAEPLASKGSA